MSLETIPTERLREHRFAKEREWYLSEEGFLDFARDSGAAPLAQFQPHGLHAKDILSWERRPDPEAEGNPPAN